MRSCIAARCLLHLLRRRRSISAAAGDSTLITPPPALKSLPSRLRPAATAAARDAVAGYLHANCNIPLHLSQLIASNSPSSLAAYLSYVDFPSNPSLDSLAPSIRRHLNYFPPPELEFFLESIGCSTGEGGSEANCRNVDGKKFFFSDDELLLPAAIAFHRAGFPWCRIGRFYSAGLLRHPPSSLVKKFLLLEEILHCCRGSSVLIAACIAIPELLLLGDGNLNDGLICDVGNAVAAFRELDGNYSLDTFVQGYKNLKAFHDAGTVPGTMVENLGFLARNSEANIKQKLEFFERLGMSKERAAAFLMRNQEAFDLDLEGTVISVPGYLDRVGLGHDEQVALREKYTHVVGRNRLINLPGVLRAVDLADWFLAKINEDRHNLQYLSSEFVMSDTTFDAAVATEYLAEKAKLDAKHVDSLVRKLEFLHHIGFGENKSVPLIACGIRGVHDRLQARFDFLLKLGMEYSKLCKMVAAVPNLLNRREESLRRAVHYLMEELGCPIDYIYDSPVLLTCDLENKLKPRYNMLIQLEELGLLEKKQFLSLTTLNAYAERRFVAFLYDVHPAAPKQWLEVFSSRSGSRKHHFDMLGVKPAQMPFSYRHPGLAVGELRRDPGWIHGEKLSDKNKWKCRYCNRVFSGGGINRLKEHVAGIGKNVKSCQAVDAAIRAAVSEEYFRMREEKKCRVDTALTCSDSAEISPFL